MLNKILHLKLLNYQNHVLNNVFLIWNLFSHKNYNILSFMLCNLTLLKKIKEFIFIKVICLFIDRFLSVSMPMMKEFLKFMLTFAEKVLIFAEFIIFYLHFIIWIAFTIKMRITTWLFIIWSVSLMPFLKFLSMTSMWGKMLMVFLKV